MASGGLGKGEVGHVFRNWPCHRNGRGIVYFLAVLFLYCCNEVAHAQEGEAKLSYLLSKLT